MENLKRKAVVSVLSLVMILGGCITTFAGTSEVSPGIPTRGTITASDHWILPVRELVPNYHDHYSGAEGYTVSSTYHRTSVEYLVCWQSTKVVRKWGTGKVQASTGYVRPPYANLPNAFKSAVYYEF